MVKAVGVDALTIAPYQLMPKPELRCSHIKSKDICMSLMRVVCRGVYELGKPKNPVIPTQKNLKKWVGLGEYGFKK